MAKGKGIRWWMSAAVWAAAMPMALAGKMLVGDYLGNKVYVFDDANGRLLRVAAQGGGLDRPLGVQFGPDGLCYVASYRSNQIKRYNSAGQFVDNYASTPKPHGLAFFGNDLIVANHSNGTVSRLGGVQWVSPVRSRSYNAVQIRDGRIFVSYGGALGAGIEEFDPATGASRGDFLSAGPGITDLQGFAWCYDGRLFAATGNDRFVRTFDGDSGAPLETMRVIGNAPTSVRFASSGELVTAGWGENNVRMYSPSAGSFMRSLQTAQAGLQQPWYVERMSPTVECRMVFAGWLGSSLPANEVRVSFSYHGSSSSLVSYTVPIQANGRFDVPSPQFLGEYDMWLKVGSFLSNVQTVDTRDAQLSTATFTLQPGDADGSNTIDADDYSIVVKSMGTSQGSFGFDSRADLNGDGVVSAEDVALVANAFGLQGNN